MRKALDQEAKRGVLSNLGWVSSPFRHAESGVGGISGVPAATSPTETVSPIHEPANPLGHVRGDTAQVNSLNTLSARTGVLTRRQQAILDVTVGGSRPTPALPHFERTLFVQSGLNPATVEEARSGPEAAQWDAAIKIELAAMEELEVWHLAFLPLGAKVIKHKWVFIKKMKSDGNLDKFKGRLVACGYAQVYRHNYFETFTPTVSLENVRMVLAMAAL